MVSATLATDVCAIKAGGGCTAQIHVRLHQHGKVHNYHIIDWADDVSFPPLAPPDDREEPNSQLLEVKCTPSCQDRDCGPDGCGGTCGYCANWQHCTV